MQAIQRGEWRQGSGALLNPGKKFSLETAAECVRRANAECDKSGVNWEKKSMILCGLDISADGVWKIEQLAEHPEAFRQGYKKAVQSISL
ncbi:hypothetical protein PHPALM_31169 [Phytophthora palmivora]|uniref:Uncharacterized protein n=1 Tax=Phytophthora palmivora TaxID=4796 RepID=A0A2P4X396_9STRA|nr:hypothetical protein PHPALM_31169 [Phytophthora palmivora]